ncbi:hypothetical protein AXG89_20840 [Burkholderia sp. PAMC 26561]|nr:hypothetical protein AXG89_20840 [Burkholderia sp. PAMC 26561]
MSGCTWITDKIANKVYSSLERPFETEAPATFVSYPSSTETEAIIGGEGRGINCSIPSIGDLAFKRPDGVSDIRLRFRQACVNHDFCYRHGFATYGYTQNDCDTALQESAYRLCRQIQRGGGNDSKGEFEGGINPYSYCETEAKKVLLGVALGGSGSYKAAGRSTYFEYDPMPERADNYVIARALPSDAVAMDPSDLGFRAFLYKRNAVMMAGQRETSPPDRPLTPMKSDFVAFPDGRVATPPQVTQGLLGTPLAALARAGFTDTSLEVELFRPAAKDDTSTLTIDSRRDVMLCKGKKGLVDCDASVYKFTQKDDVSEVLSLTHRGSLGSGNGPRILEHRLVPGAENEVHGLDTQDVHNAYRFLVHDMLVEKDSRGNATHAWVFARGVGVDQSGHYVTDNAASDFSEQVLVTRQGLGDGPDEETQRFMIDATEKNEPLNLVRVSKDGTTALIGVDWREQEAERRGMTPRLKTWLLSNNALAEKGTLIELMDETRNCYLEIPPIVARFPQMNDAQMFFPRFTNARQRDKDMCATPDDATDSSFQFDVLLAGLHLNSRSELDVLPGGGVVCEIDLTAQLKSPSADKIRERANRSFATNSAADIKPGTSAWDAAMLDLSHRWRMSQVIASERTLATGEQEVALTIVFSGFTGMSFQLLFHLDPQRGLAFDRKAGGEQFVRSCGRSNAN